MECARIKELLSEFIDGALDAQAGAVVEEHIATCKACKDEFNSLTALVKELGSLKPVQPPANFLEEIHGRVRTHSGFDRMVRKFFVPFRIKIPLELAAAATVGILAFSIFGVQQADKRMLRSPIISRQEDVTTKPAVQDRSSPLKETSRRSAHISEETSAKRPESEQLMIARKSLVRPVEPSLEMEAEETKVGVDDKGGEAIEIAILLKPEHSRNLLSKVKHVTRLSGGKILNFKYYDQTKELRFIEVEIPTKNYGSFCQELARTATLRSSPLTLYEKKMIRVRMNIIPSE